MKDQLKITVCPTCGSGQIQHVVSDLTRHYQNQVYTVPALEYYACPNCGEKVFDREAMQKIESYSPAYDKSKMVVAA